jgi:hypothetical protein
MVTCKCEHKLQTAATELGPAALAFAAQAAAAADAQGR